MPTPELLAAWTTIADGRAHYGITSEEWAPVAKALGDESLDDICVLASIDDGDYKEARDTPKLSAIKKGALNMLFGSVKMKYGFATTIVQKIGGGYVIFDRWLSS